MKSLASIVFVLLVSVSLVSSARASEPTSIVGGSSVPRGRWPDAVAVFLQDGLCTGTLIAPDVVVTAGHCIDGTPREVVIDSVDYARSGGERIRVAWARAYPDWYRRYDVGVIVLERPARTAPRIVTSACTAREHLVAGEVVEIVGFGVASTADGDDNTALRQASVAITDPTCTLDPACEPSIAPHGEFMAGGRGADSCFGDSGGPVYAETERGHALLGIVSRGLALPAAPCGGGGVYVRIDKVTSWIQSVTGRTVVRTSCSGRGDDGGEAEDAGCGTGRATRAVMLVAIGMIAIGCRRRKRAACR
jgi:secreted trypsin-like serine protease